MKNYIIKGLAAVLVAGSLASCSDDYLDVEPITTLDESSAYMTVKGAELALNGICRSMNTQYQGITSTPNMNGESFFCTWYGEMLGSDAFYWVFSRYGGNTVLNWVNNTDANGIIPGYSWRYPYNLIAQCNTILRGEDTAEGDTKERQSIMAQVRTIRAHAYIRLLQCFAPRWEDSNEGNVKCIVLRKERSTQDLPLSTMKEVLDFVYADLDKAIELYNASGITSTSFIWRPSLSVAQGLYARVAMIKHDYQKAQEMAHAARQGHAIMTADEYKGGFAEANGEWMWANAASDQIYYWAFGSWYACNGPYPTLWGYGAGAINYDLARQIPTTDVRTGLYFTPKACEKYNLDTPAIGFWLSTWVNKTTMNCMGTGGKMTESLLRMSNLTIPNGDREKWGVPYTNRTGEEGGTRDQVIPFGAQFKFWCTDTYGAGQFPFMRAAEFLLTEAEAAYYNGDEATAKACLNELLAKRNPGQTVTSTGNALLDEIRLQRRIELWGEGHCFFDLKRWSLPMVRRAWVERDQQSGNIPSAYEVRKEVNDRGWTFVVPKSETQYNHAINADATGSDNN